MGTRYARQVRDCEFLFRENDAALEKVGKTVNERSVDGKLIQSFTVGKRCYDEKLGRERSVLS